jgi:hypothetical protein
MGHYSKDYPKSKVGNGGWRLMLKDGLYFRLSFIAFSDLWLML